ncbi:MAG TPA: tyrosine-type recombinase/integrase [Spirochaetia bacterium]|nr:tyrosine-type recombinase/integrase [Spirochaetia bacterium]
MAEQDKLFDELIAIRDAYKVDVHQFVGFMRERNLSLVDSLSKYAGWLEEEHDGRRYSPTTINRKITAARSRIRYAFRHSSVADDLNAKYRLDEVLKSVKRKSVDRTAIPTDGVLSLDEVRMLVRDTRDATIKFMVMFLVGTGVRISEMLAIRMSDLTSSNLEFVEIRIVGKGGKERFVHARKQLVERVREHFHGSIYLFEHHGKAFSRISVTNRIKYESLRTIGREITARQLRHTWAIIQIQRGRDVIAVARSLGYGEHATSQKSRAERPLRPSEAFLDVPDEQSPDR